MSRRVIVVGGGASGAAAAYAASRAGAVVTVVLGRPGATALGAGALDGPAPRASSGDADERLRDFLRDLGIWELSEGGCRVATRAGLLRRAEGRDRAVLDLSRVPRGTVAVAGTERAGWDAAALARAWTAEPWAAARGLRFTPVELPLVRRASEALLPDVDWALLHDDPERRAWLLEGLRRSRELADKAALLVGPWLGVRGRVAEVLAEGLGKPVGEALSLPGGAAGFRFESARDALFAAIGAEPVHGWAAAVYMVGWAARVELEAGGAIDADAVVLAVGGLIGGGIAWSPAFATVDLGSPSARGAGEPLGFRAAFASPAALALGGAPLAPSHLPNGPGFEPHAWAGQRGPVNLERVGVWTRAGRARTLEGDAVPWLYVAGDAVADAPRTLLAALRSGLRVGEAAALGAGTESAT